MPLSDHGAQFADDSEPGAVIGVAIPGGKTVRAALDDWRWRRRMRAWRRRDFVAMAEEASRRQLGRGLTTEELERVLRRYRGEL
jgi:hypothetical protein